MATLATAWVNIVPNMKGAQAAITNELSGINTSAIGTRLGGDIGSSMSSSVIKTSSAGLTWVGKGLSKVGKIGLGTIGIIAGGITGLAATGGFNRAMAIEQAQAKLKGLGNSTEKVAEIMQNANAAVKGTAFGLGDAATVAASAVAAGIEPGEQLTKVLTTVGDTAQIAGMSFTDAGNIFTSVMARGKLQGDDMLQLTSRGVPVLKALSQQLGVSEADVSNMVSKGQIDFQTFADAMQNYLGGSALKAGDTFAGALANVKAALGRLGEKFETPALESLRDVFNKLIPLLDVVSEKVSPLADALAGKLGDAVSTVTPFVTRLTNGLNDGSVTLESITKNVSLFVGGLAGLATVGGNVGPIISAFDKLGSAGDKGLGLLTSKVRQVPGQLSSALSGVRNFGMLFNKDMREALTMDGDPFANALNRIGKGIDQLSSPFKQFGSTLANTGIGQKIGGIASQVSTGFGKLTSTVDSNARAFASKFGGMFDSLGSQVGGSKIGQIFTAVTGQIKTAAAPMTAALGNVFGGIGDIVGPSIQSGLGKIGGMFLGFFNPANFMKFFGLAAIAAALIAGLGALNTSMGGQLNTMITTFFTKLPTYIAQFQEWVTSQLPTLIQSGMRLLQSVIQGITTSLPDILTAAVTVLTTLVDGLASNLPTLIPAAAKMITTLVQGIVDNLPQIVSSGLNLLTQFVQGIVDAIPQLVAALPQLITSFVDGIMSMLPQILETGVNLLLKFINGIVDAIPQLVSALPQIISGFINGVGEHLPQILETGITLLGQLIAGIIEAIPQLIGALPQIISAIWDGLGDVDWLELGGNIISGIVSGLLDAAGQVLEAIIGIAKNALGAIKDFFGIHSPSRVMRDEVGLNIAKGMGMGIEDGQSTVQEAMGSLNADLDTPTGIDISANGSAIATYGPNTTGQQPTKQDIIDAIAQALAGGVTLMMNERGGKVMAGQLAPALDRELGLRESVYA